MLIMRVHPRHVDLADRQQIINPPDPVGECQRLRQRLVFWRCLALASLGYTLFLIWLVHFLSKK